MLVFARACKPTDNAFIESLNRKFRAECLNADWFLSLDDAGRKMEDWRRDHNEERPHSAIGFKPPMALMNRSAGIGPTLIDAALEAAGAVIQSRVAAQIENRVQL